MKSRILSVALLVLVASMVAGAPAAFAAVNLDSLVNLATQARSQIKIQLDRTPDVTQEVKDLYLQGDAQTNLLTEAAKKGDAAAAKQHFMAAMKIFRQITQTFSEPAPAAKATPAADVQSLSTPAALASDAAYRNDLLRAERYIETLKMSAEKSGLAVDFAKADDLVKEARESLGTGDLAEVDRLLRELKTALDEIKGAIKEQTAQQSVARVKAFVNDYLAKIDALLSQADELGLSEDDVAKLAKIKQELESTRDANQLIIKIKRYSVSISVDDYRSQKIQSEVSRLESRLAQLESNADDATKPKIEDARLLLNRIKNQTSVEDPMQALAALDAAIQEMERQLLQKTDQTRQSFAQETKQENQPAEDSKKARLLAEVANLEERLAKIEPNIDDRLKSKFNTAKALLGKIKDQAESDDPAFARTARALDMLLGQLENQPNPSERNAQAKQEDQKSERQKNLEQKG